MLSRVLLVSRFNQVRLERGFAAVWEKIMKTILKWWLRLPLLGSTLLLSLSSTSSSAPRTSPVSSSPPLLWRTSVAPSIVVPSRSHSTASYALPSRPSRGCLASPAPLPASKLFTSTSSHVTSAPTGGVHGIGRERGERGEGHAEM